MRRGIAFTLAILAVTTLCGCSSPCEHFNFKELSPGMFVGCRPRADADFAALRQKGIRTILSFETFTWHIAPERKRTEENGMKFQNVPIFASPFGPSEENVQKALLLIDDRMLRPTYIHCLYGRDRTAILIALYRVYFEDCSPQVAWDEALRWGLKCDWSLWGFKTYYWHHTEIPDWVRQARASGKSRLGYNPTQ